MFLYKVMDKVVNFTLTFSNCHRLLFSRNKRRIVNNYFYPLTLFTIDS